MTSAAQMDFDFAADAKRDIERLAPIARALAEDAGRRGITVADVRHEAERRGILTGEERGRRLSFLGSVMKAAGLVPTGEWRRSDIPRSHGNLHQVYRAGGAA
ncbi:MAG: hypothetical protein HOQ11_10185 [Gemmatimonadaceae bacterium]|nr:hypothetical protein [Gemmatimonadaceae bacterium]NUQ92848.1 hypothetical protein [Gemmatimonadaceae bacterium]NUR19529.1 hypothetical protein [Gemmatimonadaceae bacterium]NUS97759.1 hypothetical protein [Gemmatimonadaceae bacterium]